MKLEELKARTKADRRDKALGVGKTLEELTAAQLRALLALKLASERLLNFTLHTKPDYTAEWFHQEVAEALDRFLMAVADRRSPRLILCAPPQHGKTELVSRRFPPFALGRYPDLRVIATSYSADLAESISLDCQRAIETDEYQQIFPGTKIAGVFAPNATERRRADVFEVVGRRGSYRAAGVGGGITGQSADLLIIDDPIKDFAQAHSEAYRDTLRNWYGSTAYTRLSSGGGVLVIQTRWHEDDLVGRLLAEMKDGRGDAWEVINFPAVAERDEPHRRVGEPLAPKRFSTRDLELKKRNLGSYQWAALYQQRPAPAEGGIWKRVWWQTWGDGASHRKLPQSFDRVFQSWDCTFKDTDGSDYVCGGVWGSVGADIYLLDAVHERLDFVATIAAIKRMTARWPASVAKLVEDKANGPAVISVLRHDVPGLIEVDPQGGKVARAHAASPMIEAGNVYLPDPAVCSWVTGLIEECAGFPNAAHDDWVDMISQALNWWHGGPGGIFEFYRDAAAAAGTMAPVRTADAAPTQASGCPACGAAGFRVSGYVPSTDAEHRECLACGKLYQTVRGNDGG